MHAYRIVCIDILSNNPRSDECLPPLSQKGNAIWGMSSVCTDGHQCGDQAYIQNYLGNDTLMDGHWYKKVYEEGVQMTSGTCCNPPTGLGPGLLRDDTIARKVFWRSAWMTSDTLLYDFNLKAGDTLKGYLGKQLPAGMAIVKSVDSVQIENAYRKRINFDTTDVCSYFSIIEGIGSTTGLTACYYGAFDFGTNLECFSVNGDIIYQAPCGSDTIACAVLPPDGVKNLSTIPKEIVKVFPNPTTGKITIKGPVINTPLHISIYDLFGRKRAEMEINVGQPEMDITALPEGMYLVWLEKDRRVVSIEKLIKQ